MEVLAVAVAAEHLQALKADLGAVDRAEELCLSRNKGGALAGGLLERRLVGHELHCCGDRGHIAELEHNALMLCNGLAEGGTLVCIFDEMDSQLRALKSMKRGKVMLGIPPVISALDFPEIIMRFGKHYPDIAVEIHEDGARRLESMVLDGLLDIAISMHPVLSDGLSEIIIVQDQVVCAMNPEHPLAQSRGISYDELARYPLNTFPVNFAVYQELIRGFHARSLSPMIDVTSPTCDFLLKFSHLSNEICVLPAPCVKYYDRNDLVIRPFDPVFPWELCIVYKKNMFMSKKVRALIACIQQTIGPSV